MKITIETKTRAYTFTFTAHATPKAPTNRAHLQWLSPAPRHGGFTVADTYRAELAKLTPADNIGRRVTYPTEIERS